MFNLGAGLQLGIPELPELQGTSVFGSDINDFAARISSVSYSADTAAQESPSLLSALTGFFLSVLTPVLNLLGILLQLAILLISMIPFILLFLIWIIRLLVFWFIPGQPMINIGLLLFRALLMIELVPYIKNLVHPSTGGTH